MWIAFSLVTLYNPERQQSSLKDIALRSVFALLIGQPNGEGFCELAAIVGNSQLFGKSIFEVARLAAGVSIHILQRCNFRKAETE